MTARPPLVIAFRGTPMALSPGDAIYWTVSFTAASSSITLTMADCDRT